MEQWEKLREECLNCRRCGLADTRHNVVFGEGSPDAEVLCIGEGPGEQEDLTGRPFVGRAGKLLDDMLEIIDLSREKNIYIGNMVKCRPPQNRDPLNMCPVVGAADSTDSAQNHCLLGPHCSHEVYQRRF